MKYYLQYPLGSILKTTQRRRLRENYRVCFFDGTVPLSVPTKVCHVPDIAVTKNPGHELVTADELFLFIKHNPQALDPEGPAIIASAPLIVRGEQVLVFAIGGGRCVRFEYLRYGEYIVPRSRVLLKKSLPLSQP